MASALLWGSLWGDVHVAEEGEEQQGGVLNSPWAVALEDVAAASCSGDMSDDCMSCASLGSRPSEGGLAEGAPVDAAAWRNVPSKLRLL